MESNTELLQYILKFKAELIELVNKRSAQNMTLSDSYSTFYDFFKVFWSNPLIRKSLNQQTELFSKIIKEVFPHSTSVDSNYIVVIKQQNNSRPTMTHEMIKELFFGATVMADCRFALTYPSLIKNDSSMLADDSTKVAQSEHMQMIASMGSTVDVRYVSLTEYNKLIDLTTKIKDLLYSGTGNILIIGPISKKIRENEDFKALELLLLLLKKY